MQPPRTSSLKQVIQRSRNGMYLTKLAAAARRIFRGSGASGPVAPLSFLVSPCGVLWAGVLTVVWCSLVSEPAQGVCEPSVLAKEPLTQRSEYYGNREELRPEVWTHRDLVSRDSVEWKPPRNPVSSSGKWGYYACITEFKVWVAGSKVSMFPAACAQVRLCPSTPPIWGT